ncbi:MAG: hypothetical protein LBP40_07205 [Campylobacteraceae bacterium]|nr:hypothetical protein [Campylobacteraceae bacterium]
MTNKKRNSTPKNQQQNPKTPVNQIETSADNVYSTLETALFCAAAMICAVGLLVYLVFIR